MPCLELWRFKVEKLLWLPYGTLLSSVMNSFFFLVYDYGINSVSSVTVGVSEEILSENYQDIFPISWLLQARQQMNREFRWLHYVVKSASDCRACVVGVGWGRAGGVSLNPSFFPSNLHRDQSWNHFYGPSPHSANSRRAVVSFWQK